ncbi:BPSS1780 family membrane protein [Uliginosibacterium paludis]|uniref:BPSS1780 family membrane protein n=1 Tax=Uliginosibacterium paludis TaxID=1615952 RepID=A0ABV2CPN5_9RHOO
MSSTEHNPYTPPAAVIEDERIATENSSFIPGGRRVPAGNGLGWLATGWRFFTQSALNWIALSLVFGVLWFVLSIIPGVNFLAGIIFPVFTGGIMIACENQRQTGSLAIGDLFAGFREKLGPLALVGLISIGLSFATMIPLLLLFGLSFFGVIFGASALPSLGAFSIGGIVLAVVLMLVIGCVLWSVLWFAPALICLQNLAPMEAMKASFWGCWRNPLAGLLYGLGALFLLIIGAIPLLLGLLVVMPMLSASVYAGYRDIYFEE